MGASRINTLDNRDNPCSYTSNIFCENDLNNFLNNRDLADQIVRHGRPLDLILREPFLPFGLFPDIKTHRHIMRLVLPEDLLQGIDEPVHGVRGLALTV